jgi:hypothetical protein
VYSLDPDRYQSILPVLVLSLVLFADKIFIALILRFVAMFQDKLRDWLWIRCSDPQCVAPGRAGTGTGKIFIFIGPHLDQTFYFCKPDR